MNDNLPARPDSKTGQSQSPKGGVKSRSGETNIGFTVICCILNVKHNGYALRMTDRGLYTNLDQSRLPHLGSPITKLLPGIAESLPVSHDTFKNVMN